MLKSKFAIRFRKQTNLFSISNPEAKFMITSKELDKQENK